MYHALVKGILKRVLSNNSLDEIPILKWDHKDSNPLELKVSFVCPKRKNVSRFFYDMVSRWLIPGKHLEVASYFVTQLQTCAVCEMVLLLENPQDLTVVQEHFPFLEQELLIGATSPYHATKILERKGLNLDDKTGLVQEKIGTLVRRFPKQFDYDIFHEMQQFFISSKEAFKVHRQTSQICRLILTLYRFRKILEEKVEKKPSERHFCFKFKKLLLHHPLGLKEVLCIFVGLNFLKGNEIFQERHFIAALKHFIPSIQSVQASYYQTEGENDQIHTFYLEVEKERECSFSNEEIMKLKKGIATEIHNRIEQLVPPIFMPRNEEEVMRNILILSKQLKFLRDIPQMIVSFDEQTDKELSFTVILVRILNSHSLPVRDLFHNSPLAKNLSIDRVKIVGSLRRKYEKEASVFRVCLSSHEFLREDFSVDLFHARLQLVREIERVLGEVRDYNGGMISKQNENFSNLKKELGLFAKKNALLLQNFFHSIHPAQLATVLDAKLLKTLFIMLLESFESDETFLFKSKKAHDNIFIMIKFQDFSFKQDVFNRIESLKLYSNELLTFQLQHFDSFHLGMIYLNPEKSKQKTFLEAIKNE